MGQNLGRVRGSFLLKMALLEPLGPPPIEIFSNAIFCSLECPAVETKCFFVISISAFKTAPVLRFPAFRLLPKPPVLRFLAFGKKFAGIHAGECTDEFRRIFPKLAALVEAEMLGNEALVPF